MAEFDADGSLAWATSGSENPEETCEAIAWVGDGVVTAGLGAGEVVLRAWDASGNDSVRARAMGTSLAVHDLAASGDGSLVLAGRFSESMAFVVPT